MNTKTVLINCYLQCVMFQIVKWDSLVSYVVVFSALSAISLSGVCLLLVCYVFIFPSIIYHSLAIMSLQQILELCLI